MTSNAISGGGQISQVFILVFSLPTVKAGKVEVHEKGLVYICEFPSQAKTKVRCVAGSTCQEFCLHNLLNAHNKLAR